MTEHSPDAWVGVDLDGTLARQKDEPHEPLSIGEPIQPVVYTVKRLLSAGIKVKIFTARVSGPSSGLTIAIKHKIQTWCATHLGAVLEITNMKDKDMIALIDDRAISFPHNDSEAWSGENLYRLVARVIA